MLKSDIMNSLLAFPERKTSYFVKVLLFFVSIFFYRHIVMARDDYFSLRAPFIPGIDPGEKLSSPCFWFYFRDEKLLTHCEKKEVTICTSSPKQLGVELRFSQYLGNYTGIDCFVAEPRETFTPGESMQFCGLRSLFGRLESDLFILAGRAIQVLHWHKEHQFCGKCGTAMGNRESELAKICLNCSFISYPRLSPAVIMSIVRDDKILLARSPRFTKGMYSTLAGFVEPGETLEEAVKREVREEVNIVIQNVRYVASQPWPFPHSIMIGFSADYKSGTIEVDGKEIEDAAWFSIHDLPPLPSKITIARMLIDNFINGIAQ